MKKIFILLALVISSVLFTGFSGNKFEVSAKDFTSFEKCAIPEFPQAYQYSKAVFLGKVLTVKEEGNKKIFEFQVEKYWKGIKNKKVEISVYENMRYQANYEIGKKYLVYANSNEEEGGLWDRRCSRSRMSTDPNAVSDLKRLGKGKK